MSGRAAIGEPAHYVGHRARLRERLLQAGSEAVADYELIDWCCSAPSRAATSNRSPRR